MEAHVQNGTSGGYKHNACSQIAQFLSFTQRRAGNYRYETAEELPLLLYYHTGKHKQVSIGVGKSRNNLATDNILYTGKFKPHNIAEYTKYLHIIITHRRNAQLVVTVSILQP